jgi:hypothetical protein
VVRNRYKIGTVHAENPIKIGCTNGTGTWYGPHYDEGAFMPSSWVYCTSLILGVGTVVQSHRKRVIFEGVRAAPSS